MNSNRIIVVCFTRLWITSFLCPGMTARQSLILSPMDIDACTNQTIKFTCSTPPVLHSLKPNASVGLQVIRNRAWTAVDEKDITVVNETMSEFNYTIPPGAEIGYRYFKCVYGKNIASSLLSTITVYTMPEEVKECTCIVKNYLDSLTCTWEYEKQIYTMPQVEFIWKEKSSESWEKCRNATSDQCHLTGIEDEKFTMRNISIRITLKSKCGINVSSDFVIDTADIVKPEAVEDLRTRVINSSCIELEWNIGNARPEFPKQHFINISSAWNNATKHFSTKANEQIVGRMFCDLHPYTKYTFSVAMKPAGGGYFSDIKSVEDMTRADKPSASPQVTPGGYTWIPEHCEGDITKRDVCLLFKPISSALWNGEHGVVRAVFVPDVDNEPMILPGNTTNGCRLLPCNKDYRVYIEAQNKNGTSKNPSVLNILSASSGIDQPRFILEVTNETGDGTLVHVSILDSSEHHQYGYTAFWRRKGENSRASKTNGVEWASSNNTEIVLKIEAPETPDDYEFGVSMTSQYGGSGLKWQTQCIYTKDSTPKQAPENVHVSPGSVENTLVVAWDKLVCEPGEPYISKYLVEYCTVSGDQNCKDEIVSATGKSRVVLKKLDADQTYAVTVSGISKGQRKGPKSKTKTGVPNRFPKVWIIAVICSSIIVTVVLTVFCIVGFRVFRKRVKRFLEEAGRVTIPLESEGFHFNIKCTISGDSGYSDNGFPQGSSTVQDGGALHTDPDEDTTFAIHLLTLPEHPTNLDPTEDAAAAMHLLTLPEHPTNPDPEEDAAVATHLLTSPGHTKNPDLEEDTTVSKHLLTSLEYHKNPDTKEDAGVAMHELNSPEHIDTIDWVLVSYVPVFGDKNPYDASSGSSSGQETDRKSLDKENIRTSIDAVFETDTNLVKEFSELRNETEVNAILPVPSEFKTEDVFLEKLDKNDSNASSHNLANSVDGEFPSIDTRISTHSVKSFAKIPDQQNTSKNLEQIPKPQVITSGTSKINEDTNLSNLAHSNELRRSLYCDYVKAGENDTWPSSDYPETDRNENIIKYKIYTR